MRIRLAALALALCLLTGCASWLEREYSTAEPHSSKFWESEAADTLRAENYQDIVNDLLLLIGQHTEAAALRLYNFEDDLSVADTLERAAVEIQQETPMGAYAVEYITSSSQAQRGYYEVALQIGYRRTAEQIQAVVNATSPAGLYSLLEAALTDGKTELAVRIGYWGEDGQAQVSAVMAQIRSDLGLPESPGWVVNYYPADGSVGLIEFLLDEEAEPVDAAAELSEGDPSGAETAAPPEGDAEPPGEAPET